jgi:hypothetical protein
VTEDNGDDTYQSFVCVAYARLHLFNLKTGKDLGEEEDQAIAASATLLFD